MEMTILTSLSVYISAPNILSMGNGALSWSGIDTESSMGYRGSRH